MRKSMRNMLVCVFAASLTLLVLRYSLGTSEALFRKRQLRSVRCWVILIFKVGMLLDRQVLESIKASDRKEKCKHGAKAKSQGVIQ